MQALGATSRFERDTPRQSDPVKALAAGVVVQAMREASHGDIEALDSLEDPENGWLGLAEVSRREMFVWIVKGCKQIPGRGFRKPQVVPSKDFDSYDDFETETRRMAGNG